MKRKGNNLIDNEINYKDRINLSYNSDPNIFFQDRRDDYNNETPNKSFLYRSHVNNILDFPNDNVPSEIKQLEKLKSKIKDLENKIVQINKGIFSLTKMISQMI